MALHDQIAAAISGSSAGGTPQTGGAGAGESVSLQQIATNGNLLNQNISKLITTLNAVATALGG